MARTANVGEDRASEHRDGEGQVADDLDTRTRLVLAAAHLFARRGIEAVPLRDIGERAGQRNSSVVQYHFGGRWELVAALLERNAETVAGGDSLEADLAEAPLEVIVDGLVALLRPKLADPEGRDFLRVVFELMVRYPGRWDSAGAHEGMERLVDAIAARLAPLPDRVARARAVAMTQFVTHQLAERARLLDEGGAPVLDEETFVSNLVEMALGLVGGRR